MSEPWFPTVPRMSLEIVATLIGVLGAALIISRFPQLQQFVNANSVTLNTVQTMGQTQLGS